MNFNLCFHLLFSESVTINAKVIFIEYIRSKTTNWKQQDGGGAGRYSARFFFCFLTGDVQQVVCTQSGANGSANSQPSFKTETKHLSQPSNKTKI